MSGAPHRLPLLAAVDTTDAVVAPTSPAQQRLLFLSALEGDRSPYHLTGAMRIEGRLDVPRLREAMGRVAARHESLRTGFAMAEEAPVQVIHPAPDIDFKQIPGSEAAWAEAARGALGRFDLGSPPLWRARVIDIGPSTHLLVLDFHHLVADGMSYDIFIRETAAIYAGEDPGPWPMQCRELLPADPGAEHGPRLEQGARFWRAHLADPAPPLSLPFDFPRPPVKDFKGAVRLFDLPDALQTELRQTPAALGLTLNMYLMLAWFATLRRLGDSGTITVGFPTSGRYRRGTEGIVGMLADTAVLRLGVDPSDRIRDAAARLKERLTGAFDHLDYPFEQIAALDRAPKDLSRNPVFDTSFVYERTPARVIALRDATAEPLAYDKQTAVFDLTLEVSDTGRRLTGALEYATSLFRDETVAAIQRYYLATLAHMGRHPDATIGEIPLLDPETERSLVSRHRGPAARFAPEDTVIARFFGQAAAHPGRVALRHGGREWSFGQLANGVVSYARFLADEHRVGPDTRVGLLLDRTPEVIVAMYAVLLNRACYVPIDVRYPAARIRHIAAHAGVSLLISGPRHAHLAEALPIPTATLDNVGDSLGAMPEHSPDTTAFDPARPSDTAYIIYTSGTTGAPKGVGISHRNLINYIHFAQETYLPGQGRAMPVFTSLSFDLTVTSLFCPLASGNAAMLFDEEDPGRALARIFDPASGIDTVKLTPAHIDMLAAVGLTTTAVARAVVGGEALLDRHVETLLRLNPDMIIYNEYGPTETTVGSMIKAITASAREITVGRPITNTQIYIIDEGGRPAPPGVAGEVVIAGHGVADLEYVNAETRSDAFGPDRFAGHGRRYRTGDLGRWLPSGDLLLLGRRDDQVKLRGHRIEPAEVEAALARHAAVRAAVVLPVENGDGVPELAAWLVLEQALSADVLRDHLAADLPAYMIPTRFVRMDAIPVTLHGKVDRARLPDIETGALARTARFEAPGTEAEKAVAAAFEAVLRRPGVGRDDDFFALGGDSIKALQIAARLDAAGLSVDVAQLFRTPTVAGLARAAAGPRPGAAPQGIVTGALTPTPMASWFFEAHRLHRNHYAQAVRLTCRDPLDLSLLEQALEALISHHDGLRLTCAFDGPEVRLGLAGENYPFALETHAIDSRGDRAAAVEACCLAAVRAIDIAAGPTLAAALITDRASQQLFLAAHHLVVDGISLRVLVADLETAYGQLSRGEAVALPAKTGSIIDWSSRLAAWARSDAAARQRDYWRAATEGADPPREGRPAANTYGDARLVQRSLSEDETRAFRGLGPDIRPDELLLTAYARAARALFGHDRVRVMMEGHGRESGMGGAGVHRTVGWLTAMYPVSVAVEGRDPMADLRAVQGVTRDVPNAGQGYGALRYLGQAQDLESPALLLNYLGDTETGAADALFDYMFEPMPFTIGRAYPRRFDLELEVFLQKGRLRASLVFNPSIHREETAAALADAFCRALNELAAAAAAPRGLDRRGAAQAAMDRDGVAANVACAYPLTPLQEGMLFHHLRASDPGAYMERFAVHLEGRLGRPEWEETWALLVARHEVLRAVYRSDAAAGPLQAIIAGRGAALSYADETGRPGADVAAAFFAEEEAQGFDLGRDVLMRAHLATTGPDRHVLCLSYPHILMDGWSTGILLRDLLTAYAAVAAGTPPAWRAPAPFGDYCRRLAEQDPRGAAAWWEGYLSELPAPTPIAPPTGLAEAGSPRTQEMSWSLSADEDHALKAAAARHRLTLSAVLQGLWSLVLAHRNRCREVMFGCVVTTRPAHVAGIEDTVGLFLSTLPVRAVVDPDRPAVAYLGALQQEGVAARTHAEISLAELTARLSAGRELFDHIVAFENYPVDDALGDGGPEGRPLRITGVESAEHTQYPFSIELYGSPRTTIKFTYRADRCPPPRIAEIRGALDTVIRGFAEDPGRKVGELMDRMTGDADRKEQARFIAQALSIDEEF